MIGYIEGRVIHFEPDGILLLAGSIGYHILLHPGILANIRSQGPDTKVTLFIYYHQTERQPKPVLIGFTSQEEKEFFQLFITVDSIGPMKAVKALTVPTSDVAMAIEKKDVKALSALNGIGKRSAQKIIATLHGKVQKFIVPGKEGQEDEVLETDGEVRNFVQQVTEVLVEQLGHSHASAKRLIGQAFKRNKNISTPEELFDEIYQEDR
ncbi:MAG: Holliday junction DNA helicase RuvA [Desulfobacteraceae bacterium]|nr:Holliday junction DNA helicase RuvA [Desulfobacteraceae bacterium]